MRVARMMVIAGASLVVLAGTGACAATTTSASSAPAPTESAAPVPVSVAPAPSSRATSSPAKSAPKGTPACAAADLKISLTEQPERETKSTLMALMFLENKSSSTCRLDGWPAVTLRNAANEVVPVPTGQVNQPGAPVAADLKPGFSAAAGIKWTICEKSDEDCPVGNSLFVAPPNSRTTVAAELSGFPAPESSNITMKKLQIGSIQPSRQGVVAW